MIQTATAATLFNTDHIDRKKEARNTERGTHPNNFCRTRYMYNCREFPQNWLHIIIIVTSQ